MAWNLSLTGIFGPHAVTNNFSFSHYANFSDIFDEQPTEINYTLFWANLFYVYLTPIIVVIGLIGNTLSLRVLLSVRLRHLAASRYLCALSIADISTLILYVFCEWLQRGFPLIVEGYKLRIFTLNGICQLWIYLCYISRFLSVWLIVTFTIERFVGVCKPFRLRTKLGSLKHSHHVITALIVIASICLIYKPIVSGVRTIRDQTACTSKAEYIHESFILDAVYGLSITVVPFILITSLNCIIVYKLCKRRRQHRQITETDECPLRLEFTFILVTISFFFILFNVPFFALWCVVRYIPSTTSTDSQSMDVWIRGLLIARTFYYMNYSVNFFLYVVTGRYFRRELKALFSTRRLHESFMSSIRSMEMHSQKKESLTLRKHCRDCGTYKHHRRTFDINSVMG